MKKYLLWGGIAVGLSVAAIAIFVQATAANRAALNYSRYIEKIAGEFYIPKGEIDEKVNVFICYDQKEGPGDIASVLSVPNLQSASVVTLYYNDKMSPYQLKTTQFNKDKAYYIYDLGPLYQNGYDTAAVFDSWKAGGSLFGYIKDNNKSNDFAAIVRLNDPKDMYFLDQKLPQDWTDNTGWYASMRATLRTDGEATLANALDIRFDPGNQTMDDLFFGDQLKQELENSKLRLSKTECIAVDTSGWSFWTTLLLFSDGKNDYLLSPSGYVYFQNFLESAYYRPEERRQFIFEANKLYNFHTEVLPFLLEEIEIANEVYKRIEADPNLFLD